LSIKAIARLYELRPELKAEIEVAASIEARDYDGINARLSDDLMMKAISEDERVLKLLIRISWYQQSIELLYERHGAKQMGRG